MWGSNSRISDPPRIRFRSPGTGRPAARRSLANPATIRRNSAPLRSVQPPHARQRQPIEDCLHHHLVERQLRHVGRREGVITGQRLQDRHHVVPHRLRGQGHVTRRLGQIGQHPQHRLLLPHLPLAVQLIGSRHHPLGRPPLRRRQQQQPPPDLVRPPPRRHERPARAQPLHLRRLDRDGHPPQPPPTPRPGDQKPIRLQAIPPRRRQRPRIPIPHALRKPGEEPGLEHHRTHEGHNSAPTEKGSPQILRAGYVNRLPSPLPSRRGRGEGKHSAGTRDATGSTAPMLSGSGGIAPEFPPSRAWTSPGASCRALAPAAGGRVRATGGTRRRFP